MMVLALLLAASCIVGMAYQAAAARAVRRYMTGPRPRPTFGLPISLLKPLCGPEPGLEDNLATLAGLTTPSLQLVFGVRDAGDPALLAVPAGAELVIDERVWGRNLKVSNLLNMLPKARHRLLVIADSDVRTDEGTLDDIAAAIETPGVGLVTSPYVGRPATGDLWSRLGAMGINHGFLPSVLVARELGRCDGCFGATMALRRDLLERLGGFEQLADLLADDWALGALVRHAGWSIAVTARPVELTVHEPSLKSLLDHEIRWGRTIAALDRKGYLASMVTQPVVLGLLAALVGGGGWFLLAPAVALVVRLWAVRAEERALALPPSPLWLLVMRDILSFAVFIAGCVGRKVSWRGQRFRIDSDGRLECSA